MNTIESHYVRNDTDLAIAVELVGDTLRFCLVSDSQPDVLGFTTVKLPGTSTKRDFYLKCVRIFNTFCPERIAVSIVECAISLGVDDAFWHRQAERTFRVNGLCDDIRLALGSNGEFSIWQPGRFNISSNNKSPNDALKALRQKLINHLEDDENWMS